MEENEEGEKVKQNQEDKDFPPCFEEGLPECFSDFACGSDMCEFCELRDECASGVEPCEFCEFEGRCKGGYEEE